MVDKTFTATKAFIEHKGKVLIIRESKKYEEGTAQGKYDVVGGRVKPGQRFDESLKREVREETGLEIEIIGPFHVDEWRPEVEGEKWQIIGISFKCRTNTDKVTLSKDHDDYKWIKPEEHEKYGLMEDVHETFEVYLKR